MIRSQKNPKIKKFFLQENADRINSSKIVKFIKISCRADTKKIKRIPSWFSMREKKQITIFCCYSPFFLFRPVLSVFVGCVFLPVKARFYMADRRCLLGVCFCHLCRFDRVFCMYSPSWPFKPFGDVHVCSPFSVRWTIREICYMCNKPIWLVLTSLLNARCKRKVAAPPRLFGCLAQLGSPAELACLGEPGQDQRNGGGTLFYDQTKKNTKTHRQGMARKKTSSAS